MNKEQLINLREILFNHKEKNITLINPDEEYINIIKDGCDYLLGDIQTIYEIQIELDTQSAVDAILSNFESVIYYYADRSLYFDTMTINPCMCPYIKKKDLDKYLDVEKHLANDQNFCESKIILNEDMEFLDDIVYIDLYRLFVSNNKELISRLGDTEYIPKYNAINWFVVSLKELKNKLLYEGLELKGVETVNDVISNNYKGSITIEFEKNKTKLLKPTN